MNLESVINLLRETEAKEELASLQLSQIQNTDQNSIEENRNLKRSRESNGSTNKPNKRRKKNDNTAVYKTTISDQRRGGIPIQIEKSYNNRGEWTDEESNDIENTAPMINENAMKNGGKNNTVTHISSKYINQLFSYFF